MKSNKQRRAELTAKRKARSEKQAAQQAATRLVEWKRQATRGAVVDSSKFAPDGSYDVPQFVSRGYYEDQPFACRECGKEEVWTATQQKWWYEVAKGNVWTTARLCRPCRRRERERQAAARRIHLEGIARKRRPQP